MDANSKTTSMEFNDPLERLRKVTKPDSMGRLAVEAGGVGGAGVAVFGAEFLRNAISPSQYAMAHSSF